jgi:hypothetical protein
MNLYPSFCNDQALCYACGWDLSLYISGINFILETDNSKLQKCQLIIDRHFKISDVKNNPLSCVGQ